MSKINWQQLKRYQDIFGLKKMLFLWQEYLSCSEQYWQNIKDINSKNALYAFHNWRSSSKIFGMEDFAALCQRIEDKLQRQNYNCTDTVLQLRKIYDEDINEIKQYFIDMEQNNEE